MIDLFRLFYRKKSGTGYSSLVQSFAIKFMHKITINVTIFAQVTVQIVQCTYKIELIKNKLYVSKK